MAVLEQHPLTRLPPFLDEHRGFGTLALAHGDDADVGSLASLVGELEKRGGRIRARGQDEQQRRRRVRFVVRTLQVKRGRFDEPSSLRGVHEIVNRGGHLVRTQTSHHQKFLERRRLGPVVARVRRLLRLGGVVDGPPRRHVLRDVIRKVGEYVAGVGQTRHLAPHLGADPLLILGLGHGLGVGAHAAGEEKVELLHRQPAFAGHDPGAEQEREEQLVFFEQRSAHVLVQRVREVVGDDLQAFAQVNLLGLVHLLLNRLVVFILLRGRVDGPHEQADEPGQRVLVHRVDVREVADGEEQHRVVRAARFVPLARGVNLNLGSLGHHLLLGDLVGDNLSLLEGLDTGGVVQDVPLGGGEGVEDAVLDVLEALLVVGGLHHQLLSLRLQVGSFLGDDDAEELIAQAVQGDHEVEQRHLHGGLREVVRVTQRGGDVEAEVIVELDDALAQLDAHHAAGFEQLLQQQRLQRRVQLLLDVLQEHGETELDGVLQRSEVVAVRELDHLDVVLALHVLDPLVRLTLRIDHQRPAPGVGDHDSVVDGERIVW